MVTYPFGITTLDFSGLATKFGLWSMIISPILEPFLYLWSNLFAFPVWLLGCNYDFKTKPKCLLFNTYEYSEGDLYWNKFYRDQKKLGRAPTGWQCYVDFDGSINLSKTGGKGKLIESFFGIINEFDAEIDRGRNKMIFTPKEGSKYTLSRTRTDKTRGTTFYFVSRTMVCNVSIRFFGSPLCTSCLLTRCTVNILLEVSKKVGVPNLPVIIISSKPCQKKFTRR